MLEGQGVNAWYGDVQVLRDVSFEVQEREIVAVVGANAAGKSTLLLTISGIVPHLGGRMAGNISFNGTGIDGMAAHKIMALGLVHIMEGRRLFPFLTVQENLELGCYHARARTHLSDSLEQVFELLPVLKDRRLQLAGSLSGGEQQMCAIGRGLMARPKLMMLDEPTIGLAPLYVEKIFEILKGINSQGTTILLVEQNVKHSLGLAHRGYVLENGRVVLSGESKELLNHDGLRKAYLGM